MRNLTEIYHPTTVDEALALLQRETPRTRALAGGTALVGEADPTVEAVVDLSQLELSFIREEADALVLGAGTTLQILTTDARLKTAVAGRLVEAAQRSASSLLRRRATLGGSLLSGQAPDLAALLIALGAQAEIAGAASPQPVSALYEEGRDWSRALLLAVRVPRQTDLGVGYHRVARTPGDAPIVCVAAALCLADGNVARAGLAVGMALIPGPEGGPRGLAARLGQAEALLTGQPLSNRLIEAVAAEAAQEAPALADPRASAEYRAAMVGTLARRAIGDAWRGALEPR